MSRMKQPYIQKFSIFLAVFLTICIVVPVTARASLPEGNVPASKGKVYDGIDIASFIGSGIYFGAYKHATVTGSTRSGFGTQATAYELFDTPILWRVMGEDRVSSGSVIGDEHLALMSEYTVDFKRISGYGNETLYVGYDFFVGEADYGVSYTNAWLNTEGTYTYAPNNSNITGNPSRYGYVPFASEPGFLESFKIGSAYRLELDAMGQSDANTFFIGNGTNGLTVGQVVTNPSVISGSLGSEWSNYFSSGVPGNTSWPYVYSNAYAYISFGIGATNTIYWNADGEPSINHTINTSVNKATNGTTLKSGGTSKQYWLRNPSSTDTSTRNAFVSGNSVIPVHNIFSRDVLGVRPVVKLDPTQILMMYEIVTTKSLAHHIATDIGDPTTTTWNYVPGADTNYKLTLISNDVSITTATLPAGYNDMNDAWALLTGGSSITLTSTKGTDYIGDYLAYKIVEESSGNREIVAYGDNKGAADLNQLVISHLRTTQLGQPPLGTGDFTLYVWAQKEDVSGESGTSIHSFEGSTPISAFAPGPAIPIVNVTLTYDKNSGTDSVSNLPLPQNTTAGTTINISGNTPTRVGYIFKGWNTHTNGSGIWYAVSSSILMNADITLYAQWDQVSTTPTPGPTSTPTPTPTPSSTPASTPTPTPTPTSSGNGSSGGGGSSNNSGGTNGGNTDFGSVGNVIIISPGGSNNIIVDDFALDGNSNNDTNDIFNDNISDPSDSTIMNDNSIIIKKPPAESGSGADDDIDIPPVPKTSDAQVIPVVLAFGAILAAGTAFVRKKR